MTGRQIRLPAILSKVQLFPWVRAIEVIPAVPETAELDSLLGRARCCSSPPLGSQPSPHSNACPGWAECKVPLGHSQGHDSSFSCGCQGISAPPLAAAVALLDLSPTCHSMKGRFYICWEEWPGLAFSQEDFHKIQGQLCLLRLQINCSSSGGTQWNQMIHSRSRRKPTSLGGIKCSTWDLYSWTLTLTYRNNIQPAGIL